MSEALPVALHSQPGAMVAPEYEQHLRSSRYDYTTFTQTVTTSAIIISM